MAVPAAAHDLAWLRDALQAAVALELFTIPPYLTAMWSIKAQAGPVYSRLRATVIEEMFHFGLACNMLTTLGGTPQVLPGAAPAYPGEPPGGVLPGLTVRLEKLSQELVRDVFMAVEAPDWPGVVGLFAGETYATIGAFYAAVQAAFDALDPAALTGQRQLTRGAALFAIPDKDAARKAIRTIREQGEGTPQTPLNPGNKPAHYYKFGEIVRGREAVATPDGWKYQGNPVPFPAEVFDMAPVPAGGYAKSHDFDARYTGLLASLQKAWADGDAAALDAAFDAMYELGDLARGLMQQPLPAGGGNYGPSFLIVT
jgi:hypothetical protein